MSTIKELREKATEAINALYSACERDVDKLEDKVLKLEEELEEIEEAKKVDPDPEWGNCRRGCAPAFINSLGFCSPACAMGAPRGEFVTLPKLVAVIADKTPDWDADRGDGFNSQGYEAGRGIYHDPMG